MSKGGDPYAKMRELENKLAKFSGAAQDEARAAVVTTWHEKSDAKVKSQVVQKRIQELMALREAKIDDRRRRLADKLFAEDNALRGELAGMRETPEQRREKLATRARDLAARREAERAALAASLKERAFMESCDVLRETNSKRILYRTIEERNAQIEQRMAKKIMDEEEKHMYHEMMEQERLKMEQRYQDDKRRERERRDATLKVLDEQVRYMEQRKRDQAELKQQEVDELRQLWDKVAREQEEMEMAEREKMKQLAEELQEFNRLKQMEMSERDRRERELDLRILQEALAREANEEAREAEERTRRREDVRRYRLQLAAMMSSDADDEARKDALIQAEADRQQAKWDAEARAREEARMRLMAEVDAIRQQQIRDYKARLAAEQEGVMMDRLALEEDQRRQAAEDGIKRQQMAKTQLERRLDIQTQMVAKAHLRAAEEDDKLRELEVAKHAEAAYMGQVTDSLAKTDPPSWYGRKKHNWYS